jgi:acyl-ACP thioesterase
VGIDANNSNYQKWIVENLGNELYRLRNVGSQRYMMVDSSDPGDQLEQDNYENKANYHWILRPIA